MCVYARQLVLSPALAPSAFGIRRFEACCAPPWQCCKRRATMVISHHQKLLWCGVSSPSFPICSVRILSRPRLLTAVSEDPRFCFCNPISRPTRPHTHADEGRLVSCSTQVPKGCGWHIQQPSQETLAAPAAAAAAAAYLDFWFRNTKIRPRVELAPGLRKQAAVSPHGICPLPGEGRPFRGLL